MIKTIQGLRGFSALLILLSHYSFFKRVTTIFPDNGVAKGQNVLMWTGAMGVSIFIILSGFLTYIKFNDDYEIYNIKKRVLSQYKRFLPLHIITMILSVPLLIRVYMLKPINTIIKLFFNITMLQAWLPHVGIYYSFNAVSWYLCLVVFFAVMTPFMLRMIRGASRRGKYGILMLIMSMVILQGGIGVIADKISKAETIGVAHWLSYIFPITRLSDFFIGGGIGYIYFKKKNCKRENTFVFLCVLFVCCINVLFSNMYKSELFSSFVWTIPCAYVVYRVALANEDNTYLHSVFESKILQFLGSISFELFLLHQLVVRYILKIASKWVDDDAWYLYLVSLIISLVLSYITHEFLNWIRKKSDIY